MTSGDEMDLSGERPSGPLADLLLALTAGPSEVQASPIGVSKINEGDFFAPDRDALGQSFAGQSEANSNLVSDNSVSADGLEGLFLPGEVSTCEVPDQALASSGLVENAQELDLDLGESSSLFSQTQPIEVVVESDQAADPDSELLFGLSGDGDSSTSEWLAEGSTGEIKLEPGRAGLSLENTKAFISEDRGMLSPLLDDYMLEGPAESFDFGRKRSYLQVGVVVISVLLLLIFLYMVSNQMILT